MLFCQNFYITQSLHKNIYLFLVFCRSRTNIRQCFKLFLKLYNIDANRLERFIRSFETFPECSVFGTMLELYLHRIRVFNIFIVFQYSFYCMFNYVREPVPIRFYSYFLIFNLFLFSFYFFSFIRRRKLSSSLF